MPGSSVEGMLEARCFISSQDRSQERRGENEVGKQPHERDRSREREQSNQIHRPANARVACWHGCSVERLGVGSHLEQCSLFKSVVSHVWSHKKSVMRPSSTESSGDLEKNAVFSSKCSCRVVCTCIVM